MKSAVSQIEEQLKTYITGEYYYVPSLSAKLIIDAAKEMEKEQMVDFAYKYGDLTIRQIADAFDNEYINKK
jgi:hypothetical protein